MSDAAQDAFFETYDRDPSVTRTASGLRYKVVKSGGGDKRPGSARARVTVHYAGKLIDGTEFDSSYRRGETATFGLNQVIAGWTEGVKLMAEGDTYEFALPYQIAYGERGGGPIPPKAPPIFTVELVKVV